MRHKILNLTVVSMFLVFSNNIASSCQEDGSEQNTVFSSEDYCEKLQKHVSILKKFSKLNKEKEIIDFNSYFLLKNIEYKNEIVKLCIQKMTEEKNLDPLLKTWKYAHALCISKEDIGFIREFSILIFSTYENLLVVLCASKADSDIKGTLEDIIQVYNTVSDLPIKEIILTLEKCYILFSKILKDYGAFSAIGWKRWLRTYWWLPPTLVVAVIGAFLKQKMSFDQSNPSIRKFDYLKKRDNDSVGEK